MAKFLDLLEKAWQWRAPPKWIAFLFLVETILGLLVIWTFFPTYKADGASFIYVVGNVVLLYLWLLVTGRTTLRLKTANESDCETPRGLLAVTAVAYLLAAAIMTAGNKGLEETTGEVNRFSYYFMAITPGTLVCGLFNAILCISRPSSRLVLTSVAVANGALALGVTASWLDSRAFQRPWDSYSRSGILMFGYDKEFRSTLFGQDFPLQPVTTFHILRMLPIPTLLVLPAATALMSFSALVKVGVVESVMKQTGPRSKSLAAAFLGSVMFILSIVLASRVSFISSLAYFFGENFVPLPVATLCTTICALGALSMVKKSNNAMKVGVMLSAALVFIASYNSFYMASTMEKSIVSNHKKMLASRCVVGEAKEAEFLRQLRNSNSNDTTTEFTEIMDQFKEEEACFASDDSGVLCLAVSKLCDGIVDITDRINHYCDGDGKRVYQDADADDTPFVDELHCPDLLSGTFTSLRMLGWAGMATSVALILVLGLGVGGREKKDVEEEEEDETAMAKKVRKLLEGMADRGATWKGDRKTEKLDDDDDDEKSGKIDSQC